MALSISRAFTAPLPGEDLAAIAARCLPELPAEEALDVLRSWNLHLFARQPSGVVLGADIVFLQAPLADAAG
jgi:hypothetical protein